MKYLKGYNERLSQDNRSNIQEILSELIDNVKPKLWVVYSDNGNFGDSKSNPPTVGGYYTHDNYSFHYTNLNDFIKLLSDFKDSIPRLESYCKDEDIKLNLSTIVKTVELCDNKECGKSLIQTIKLHNILFYPSFHVSPKFFNRI